MRLDGTPLVALALTALWLGRMQAQQPVTRAQAVDAALARGSRAALGRADTAAARGLARSARAFPNPLLSTGYTKDAPQYHAILDVPLDLPWLRAPRIGAAEAARDAARYGFAFERAAIRFDVETTYTHALSAALHARLSRRTAADADSLRRVAEVRRDAGDVSELDVRVAAVNAGQLENVALDDSLAAVDALLELQLQMGLSADEPAIVLTDSLAAPAESTAEAPGEPLPVAAAAAALRSEERTLALARRSLFAPSLELGVEAGEPGVAPTRLLPTIGVSFPLPLFNWNGGEVARAAAGRNRAQAELDLARRETGAAIARARRDLAAARAHVRRDAGLLASADRIAAMSILAFAEGAVALANVLEAQRNAREVLSRYIDDLAAADVAAATLRLFTAADRP
jgi:cobalt-zinc-cadmium efflux system outer membrane protein